jgi:hypothetical protein
MKEVQFVVSVVERRGGFTVKVGLSEVGQVYEDEGRWVFEGSIVSLDEGIPPFKTRMEAVFALLAYEGSCE